MPDYELLFPSDYIKAADLIENGGRDVVLTIKTVQLDELQMRGGKTRMRGVMTFANAKKKLVLNRTNGDIIASIHGRDFGLWPGKSITIYPTKVRFGRDTVDAIRVREVDQTKAAAAAKAAPADPPMRPAGDRPERASEQAPAQVQEVDDGEALF